MIKNCTYTNSFPINEEYKVIDCKECNFYHVNPYPDNDFLTNFYSKKYVDELSKINLKEKAERIKQLSDKNKILDIGCGNGDLLQEFKNIGFDTYGIEPSEDYVNHCIKRGLNVKKGFLNKNPFGKKFDIINMSFLLEHVPNPLEFIENVKNDFLSDNGYLSIEIPNDFNALQMIYLNKNKELPYWIHFPDHLNYWNFETFKKFLNRMGFDIVYQTSSFPLELFLLMGDDYIKNKELGKELHQKRLNLEKKFKEMGKNNLIFEMYTKLSELNIGREINVIAKKR